jgi:hypothetical protein
MRLLEKMEKGIQMAKKKNNPEAEVLRYELNEETIKKQIKDSVVISVLKEIANTLNTVTSNGLNSIENKVLNSINNMESKYQLVYKFFEDKAKELKEDVTHSNNDRMLLRKDIENATKMIGNLSHVLQSKMREDKKQGFIRDKGLASAISLIKNSQCPEDFKKKCKPVIEAYYEKLKSHDEHVQFLKSTGKSFFNKLLDKIFLILASVIVGAIVTWLIIKQPWIKQYIKP